MIKAIRVMLIPNNKQKTKLFQYASTARFAYNWALGGEQENYKNGGTFISDGAVRKESTQLKMPAKHIEISSKDIQTFHDLRVKNIQCQNSIRIM